MPISDRIEGTIEIWSQKWKDRLRGWLAGAIGFGVEVFMEVLAKSAAPKLRPIIETLEKSGKVPAELKPILEEIKNPTGESAATFGLGVHGPLVGGAIGKLADAVLLPLAYWANSLTQNVIISHQEMIETYLRGYIDKETLYAAMAQYGLSKEAVDYMLLLRQVRFPSDVVAPAWLRDKTKYEKFWEDVRTLGVTDDRIELLKEMAYKLPTADQAITWMAREVFEEDMAAKYGLDDESDKIDYSFMETIGIKEEVARKHWRAHWQHASWSQIVEMLHRGMVTEQDVYDWFRLVEIPPYWRRGLTATMWQVPGRIETRMMAQYGLVDKAFIMDILEKDGLAEEYRSVVADMNLVRGIRTDIQSRYSKGWLDAAGVKAEIDKAGLSPQIAERLYQWIVSNAKGDRTTAEKDLTKAEIVKAVKKGLIPWQDGITRLMALGYDEDEADLIMMQNVEVVEEGPTTELNVRVDTVRRQRRQRLISRDQEISSLLQLGIDHGLATAYADNDDLRLAKVTEEGT